MRQFQLFTGDAAYRLRDLDADSAHCCVTSPPYYRQRDYSHPNQLGQEASPDEYLDRLLSVFAQVHRVLRHDGTLWIVISDSYKNKQLLMLPARLAIGLQEQGWLIRQDIIWSKRNTIPEGGVRDRCTRSHEYVLFLSKNKRYYFDQRAIQEEGVTPAGTRGGKGSTRRKSQWGVNARPACPHVYTGRRNKRSVWTTTTAPGHPDHGALFPPQLIEPCVLAGCPPGGTVLDPFSGLATTGLVALSHRRRYVGIDINYRYNERARARLAKVAKALYAKGAG